MFLFNTFKESIKETNILRVVYKYKVFLFDLKEQNRKN